LSDFASFVVFYRGVSGKGTRLLTQFFVEAPDIAVSTA